MEVGGTARQSVFCPNEPSALLGAWIVWFDKYNRDMIADVASFVCVETS